MPPGQFIFPSPSAPPGAGKATLLRLLFAAEAPISGSVVVGGADLGRLRPGQRPLFRRKVGVIFQDFKLVGVKSVFENVALTLRVASGRGPELVKWVAEVMAQMGLNGAAETRTNTLNGGEQQRAAIARALVGMPSPAFGRRAHGQPGPGHGPGGDAQGAGMVRLQEGRLWERRPCEPRTAPPEAVRAGARPRLGEEDLCGY